MKKMKLLKIALELVLLVIGSMFGTQATKISFTLLPGDETSKMIYTKANKDSGTAYVSIQPPKVPVLLYHYVKKSLAKGTLHSVPRDTFYQQIKMLHDSGYQTISPDELYSSFTTGSVLPPKPIILTFDDTHEEHYFIVAPILAEFAPIKLFSSSQQGLSANRAI
ncbi:MAG TPA: hypothetical protein VKA49_08215 [Flavitalea sp.]|nr:hypothetical protein [Flavitalea sp.]